MEGEEDVDVGITQAGEQLLDHMGVGYHVYVQLEDG